MSTTKKAILVVSFGTSYAQTREKNIGAIEEDFRSAFPEYTIRRALNSVSVNISPIIRFIVPGPVK